MPQKLKKHLSPWIAWSLVVLAAAMTGFAVWACWFQIDTISDNISISSIKPATTTPASTAATADWKSVTNTIYGFSLTLTNAWSGFSFYAETPSNGNALKYIRFLLPSTDTAFTKDSLKDYDKEGVVNPFTISVFTLDGFAKEKADAGAAGNPIVNDQSISQNNKYVFQFSSWQDAPSDLRNKDLGLDAIKNSFKTTNVK